MTTLKASLIIFAIIALAIFLVVAGPIAVIFSLNTLFGLSIPVDFNTWVSVIVLYCFLNAAISTSVKIKK